MRVIVDASNRGGKVVVIDPQRSATARRADEHLRLRPGTDTALALGMINVILSEGLQDEGFLIEHTVGPLLVRKDSGLFLRESDVAAGGGERKFMVFDRSSGQVRPCDAPGTAPALAGEYPAGGTVCRPAFHLLADMVSAYTPEKASEITDVPADVIRRLAVEYATRKPAAIHRGWGMQRTFYGDVACRAVNTLAAVTGNINPSRPSRFVLNTRNFQTPAGWYNRLPIMLLYDAITRGEPQAVKAVCFAGRNFVNQLPNMNRIVGDLIPRLELIVVCDLFMTETARYADYVLPAASFLECVDLVPGGSAWVPYLQLQRRVIEPLHESRPDFEIAAGLGRRMGLGEYFDKTEEQYIEEILDSGHPSMSGVTLERLKEGPVEAESAERPPEFRTPTGRIEFYVEKMKDFGQELPVYLEPVESARREKAKTYPLSFVSPHSRYRLHSTMANVGYLARFAPDPLLEISPEDAAPRDIADGDTVHVFNDRGEVRLRAKVTDRLKPGVVALQQGWWPDHYLAGHHNQLTHEEINPARAATLGPNAALCDVLVEVRRTT